MSQPTSGTLVLLSSLGTTTRIWNGVRDALATIAPDVATVAVDLPGHGDGKDATGPLSIGILADEAIAEVESRGATSVVVAGVSMGGAIALDIAVKRPAWLAGFAMFNSVPTFGGAGAWDALIAQVRTEGTSGLRGASRDGWFAAGFADTHAELVDELLNDLDAVDDDSYVRCCEALASYDATPFLSTIDTPALIVAGSDDRGPTPLEMRALADRFARARFAELPSAAHLLVVEQPEMVAHLLFDLIRSPPFPSSDQADS
jgi:3-oxoadipate enol-lactonase/4-carboxymuconolactone decarboxylase